jgi:hypothetical protein
MKGAFWNIRGLNQPLRKLSLSQLIKGNHLDFVRVIETKKEVFPVGFLESLASQVSFSWHYLPAKRTACGILMGVRADFGSVSSVEMAGFSITCVVQNSKGNFLWKLVVVYGPHYDDKKVDFIDELHGVFTSWQGPINLSRFVSDKSNGRTNHRFLVIFNDWVNKLGLIELNPGNRKLT